MKRLHWTILAILLAPGFVAAGEGVQIKVAKDHIDFSAGGELVTRYQMGPKFPRPIFWPLLAPGGVKVTRSWPMVEKSKEESDDHIHQKSAWFCHGDVIPEGIELKHKIRGVEGVDYWSENKGHGRIVTTKVGTPKKGSVVLKNEWQTADGDKIMDETRKITLHDFGKARLIVLDVDLLASVCPITFGDTKEGAVGIRVNDQIRGDRKFAPSAPNEVDKSIVNAVRAVANRGAALFNGQGDSEGCYRVFEGGLLTAHAFLGHRPEIQRIIKDGLRQAEMERSAVDRAFALRRVIDQVRIPLEGATGSATATGKLTNAEGKTYEKGCWGQISAWCDYSGPIDGKVAGIAVLADPKNPHPTCWHARNYGLMAANPFGRKKALFPATKDNPNLVRLAKGEHLRMRYGILVHAGDCETANVAELYQRFVKLREDESK